MNINTAALIVLILAGTVVFVVRALPWEIRWSRPNYWSTQVPAQPSPVHEHLDAMDDISAEISELLDHIDQVYVDSHTRKWTKIPESHTELFDVAYRDRPTPPIN